MGAIFLCFRSGRAGSCGGVKTPPYGAIDTPTGCRKWVADERGKGGRQPTPFAVGGGCRSLFTAFSMPFQSR